METAWKQDNREPVRVRFVTGDRSCAPPLTASLRLWALQYLVGLHDCVSIMIVASTCTFCLSHCTTDSWPHRAKSLTRRGVSRDCCRIIRRRSWTKGSGSWERLELPSSSRWAQ